MGRRATRSSGRPKILTLAFALLVVAVAIYILCMAWMMIKNGDDGCGQRVSVKVPGAAIDTTVGNTCNEMTVPR
jgi:uncharacterized membrane protein